MVKKEIEIIPEKLFDRAVEKEDIIIVFKTNRTFLLCDKEYGVKIEDGVIKVMRVIGGGCSHGNRNQKK